MVEVKQELVESFFQRYELGKSNTNYTDVLVKEQPVLFELISGLLDYFDEEVANCKTKAEVLNLTKKQVRGLIVMMYSLLKEQEEINDLEDQHAQS